LKKLSKEQSKEKREGGKECGECGGGGEIGCKRRFEDSNDNKSKA
jgi:hypothetical protein